MNSKRASIGLAPTIFLVAALILGTAWATEGNLPGGTSISVEITSPADGTLIAYPPGDVPLEGTASIGEGLPLPDTLIVYVLDVSVSTIDPPGLGCGGDANGDGLADTILDCEIEAANALNDIAVTTGTVGDVGVAVFGGQSRCNPADASGDAADVGPAAGDQLITGPDTDVGGLAGRDVEEVLNSVVVGGVGQFTAKIVGGSWTNFAAGLEAAVNVAAASGKTNKMIVFMSDGLNNTGKKVSEVPVPPGVVIHAFAIGSGSSCTGIDDRCPDRGTLTDVVNQGDPGGTCEWVGTIADLPDVVPGVIASRLLSLTLSVDGGAPIDISASASPSLPQEGPASVDFSHLVSGLTPGTHELCVTAAGTDAGGAGQVTDCIDVTVADINLDPPTATNELGFPGQTHTATATVAAGAAGGIPGVSVSFEILSGPNVGEAGMGVTDGSGQADFTYTAVQGLAGLGTDVIQACFVDDLGIEVCDGAEKEWVDTTPPEVACEETTNPSGKNVPKGRNPDGFYELTATDLVDPAPQIFLVDTGSGTLFGPFASGTKIKYTEAPGGTPSQKKMGSTQGKANAINWHIIGNGDACVYAIDWSGNQADCVDCLVPPPPK